MDDPVQKDDLREGLRFNRPSIIAMLYLLSFLTGGLTSIIGVVLAYVWQSQPHEDWESSHYKYLIRTFGILIGDALLCLGMVMSFKPLLMFLGVVIAFAILIVVIVRCVLSLVSAQKRLPMPNPDSWLT